MPVEEALTYVIAVAVPVWLAVEQVLIRRRAARERQRQAIAADRNSRGTGPTPAGSRPGERPRRAA